MEVEHENRGSSRSEKTFATAALRQLRSRIPSRSRSAYILSRLFYRSVPVSVKTSIMDRFGRAWRHFCPVCEDRVPGFSPLSKFYSEQLELHGSDLQISDFETCNSEAYQCPHCGATDRDRLYALHLARALPKSFAQQANFKLLDIAPSTPLSNFIRRKFSVRYRTADRYMKNVDDRIDITAMDIYPTGSFDAFICSHVLEHVQDDRKSMAELWRVLKPGGWGIAMAPIHLTLDKTRENASCVTEGERWRHFGQGDHVRIYSREGFVERLQQCGFGVRQLREKHFESESFLRCGLSPGSVLYIVEKAAVAVPLHVDDHESTAETQSGDSPAQVASPAEANRLPEDSPAFESLGHAATDRAPGIHNHGLISTISLNIVPKEELKNLAVGDSSKGAQAAASSASKPNPSTVDLAIAGERPQFSEPLHVGRPNIGDKARLMQRFEEILERRWFTNDGPLVKQFEQKISEITGAKHCISICNATVALEIAIRALELQGEVIVPSYTFVATAHALQWQEITPVFADIDPKTLNIDPHCLERLITPRTTGIIGVHLWGRPCDTKSIEQVARQHHLKVLYDAAHAFGCSHEGTMIGNFGECEIMSFHATKFINSFEGGAILTNNGALAEKIRLMRNFGFAGFDRVTYLGTNGKMTEICAAMGLTSLESMENVIQVNREHYETYRQELSGLRGLTLLEYSPTEKPNYHYVVVEVDSSRSPLNRDELVAVLHAENVLARKYFWPGCHRMEPYRSLFPNAHLLLPHTEAKSAQIVVLPTGQSVSQGDIVKICNIIKSALGDSAQTRRTLEHNSCPHPCLIAQKSA